VIGCNVAKVVVAPLANYNGLTLSSLPRGSQSSEFGQFHALEPVQVEECRANGIYTYSFLDTVNMNFLLIIK
jgi:predicted alternative tryptophan synthase beta-subunit